MAMEQANEGLCTATFCIAARQILSTVCIAGGAACPLMAADGAREMLERTRRDPTVTIRLASDADVVPHYTTFAPGEWPGSDAETALNHKRDLDVLQRLGLAPGDTRRARYLYTLLFERIETPWGICAHDTPGWEGCPLARSGAFERVRAEGWPALVRLRPQVEKDEWRQRSVEHIARDESIYIRPHHLMCIACWYAGGDGPASVRPEDTLAEILERIRRDPGVLVTLVAGTCEACNCCDGFDPATTRCVHGGGLIRDYKKDLDMLQRLGLMPGATLPARECLTLMFERIHSTTEVCGYGDGVVRSNEWSVCGGPDGNPGYVKSREKGML
jgi:hypothetical protein